MPRELHVVEKYGHFKKLAAREYESGYWSMTLETANTLVGGYMYCHPKQLSPSFFGGEIKSCRLVDEGEYQGRIIFTLTVGNEFKGVTTSRDGWRNDYKIVRT